MDSSVSRERRNLVSARVPSHFKRSLPYFPTNFMASPFWSINDIFKYKWILKFFTYPPPPSTQTCWTGMIGSWMFPKLLFTYTDTADHQTVTLYKTEKWRQNILFFSHISNTQPPQQKVTLDFTTERKANNLSVREVQTYPLHKKQLDWKNIFHETKAMRTCVGLILDWTGVGSVTLANGPANCTN